MKRLVLSFVLVACVFGGAAPAAGKVRRETRKIEGIIYFTNNSVDKYDFLVELFSSRKRRVDAMRMKEPQRDFVFDGLKPGIYYLQVSGSPRICLLQYKVDVRQTQPERLRVFGDADCGKSKIAGLPSPRPFPQDHENR